VPFEWKEYLRLARALVEQADEAAHRSAISRAYYAAFGSAVQALSFAGHKVPEDGSAHEYVWSVYRDADDGPLFYIAQDGARLRSKRRTADYLAHHAITRIDAQKACREAETAINAIERHSAPAPAEES
jgi:uncharacterized protein (UPF0332 family)